MSQTLEDQALALAGLFQAAALVRQIAHEGQCDDASFETSIRSLFETDPDTTLDVFGGQLGNLQLGLDTLSAIMAQRNRPEDAEILRYTLGLVQLEGQLRKRTDMLEVIGSRIDQARHTANHFGYHHGNLMANLASVYSDTLSTFRQRIQVTGNPAVLQREENAARIRALLLAGIRSAVLWRQCGGRRWRLLFQRRKLIDLASNLAKQAR
ncbi:high frequency lysogenization protein HflD [Marinobacter sp. C2H3]|uniref:high frequency lysogenization protein HflD n=1 Tax=Marinobacter sp. C2H3 TaxID=3119003 RepID=UPI00300F4F4F